MSPSQLETLEKAVGVLKELEFIGKGLGALIAVLGFWKVFPRMWDAKVLKAMQQALRDAQVKARPGANLVLWPVPLKQIAVEVHRSEVSVRKSLMRLEQRGEVHELSNGWLLGERPQPLTMNDLRTFGSTAIGWRGSHRWS